jgi:DMSO reductase anchor subunit
MLWTIFTILCGLWVLALFSGNTVGGFVHILLVIAIVVILVKVYQDRKLNV